MHTTAIGQRAEQAAADYLVSLGYRITVRNWKRPLAEIDIVAQRSRTLYFVEVKYRAHDYAGSGLEYITRTKLRHMWRAAQLYMNEVAWTGQYQLAAIEVSGPHMRVGQFIDSLDMP